MQALDLEDSGLYITLLLSDVLFTILRESAILTGGDSPVVVVVGFVLIATIFFTWLAIINFVYLYFVKHERTLFVASFIQAIGGLLYYYGDNVSYVLNQYHTALGCYEQCLTNNRITASFALGIALVIFNIWPPVLKKLFIALGKKFTVAPTKAKYPDWSAALDMVAVFIKIDALYSAVTVMVESSEFCSRGDVISTNLFFILCMALGATTEGIYYFYVYRTNRFGSKFFKISITVGLVVLIICFPLYILSDNHQPLDCPFGCDRFASNLTLNALNCQERANASVRLAFAILAFVSVAALSLFYFIGDWTAKEVTVKEAIN